MYTRIAIQILSFNRPQYLKQTIDSLKTKIGKHDKICVLEQSDIKSNKKKCLDICNSYENIYLIDMYKNLGQRLATNIIFNTGFFENSEFVMLSDHDNIYHEDLTIYCDKLKQDKSIWCATGYTSLEHDIERKDWSWLIKSTARAGHMVFRYKDFISMLPIDVNYNAGTNCSWFAGLDWWLTWWNKQTPGFKNEREFIACYPGGTTHIGEDSSWQGIYNQDDISQEEAIWMQDVTLEDIIEKYPPQHKYLSYKYYYEVDKDLAADQNDLKEYKYNLYDNDFYVYDFKNSQSPDQIFNELRNDVYNISNIEFKDGDIVLDLGANIGLFSISLAKKYPNILIYCYESSVVNFKNLLKGIKKNNIKNIIANNYAIVNTEREMISVSSINFSGGAMITNSININDDRLLINKCNTISFDKIFKKCKLLKIDIEGFEHEIFNNVNNLELLKSCEYLSAEFHFEGSKQLKENCIKYTSNPHIRLESEDLKLPNNISDILKIFFKEIIYGPEKVYVLIPTFQRYNLLNSILTDLTNQRYKNFETIVCSDGYDYNTKNIVNNFKQKLNIQYVNTIERANDWGRTPREKLISCVSDNDNNYIIFIDDDDSISPQYIQELVKDCSSDTISYCNIFLASETINGERIIPGREMDKFLYGYISAFCCLFPIDVVKKCFHKWNKKRDSDFDFVNECTKYKKLKYIPHLTAVAR